MSFPLRPYQPNQDSPQEDQQQLQQPGAVYGTYSIHGDPLPQQQAEYPQYQGPYQWQAAGYLNNGAAAGQTYYGSPYPPPPESPFGNGNAGGYYAGGAGVPPSGYSHSQATPTVASQPRAAARTTCGIKRDYFLILVAIGFFVLVLGISLGVGLGLTSNHSNSR